MPENSQFEKVQSLLRARKGMRPSDTYMEGVLPEFHRRLRSELLQPKTSWSSLWENLRETLASAFTSPAGRLAFATACVVVAATWSMVSSHSSSAPVALAQNSAQDIRKSSYAFSEGWDAQGSPSVDEKIDRLTIGENGFASEEARPHYVMTSSSADYDVSVVF